MDVLRKSCSQGAHRCLGRLRIEQQFMKVLNRNKILSAAKPFCQLTERLDWQENPRWHGLTALGGLGCGVAACRALQAGLG